MPLKIAERKDGKFFTETWCQWETKSKDDGLDDWSTQDLQLKRIDFI